MNDGRTHYEGCWRSIAHHDCAVAEIERLQQEWDAAQAELAALRARVAEAERQLRALVFNTHTPHDLAKAKEDAIRWLTPSAPDVHTPKPVCKQCGRSLDARGKCRVPEHNP